MSRPIFVAERLADSFREGLETALRVGTPFYIGIILFCLTFGVMMRLLIGVGR